MNENIKNNFTKINELFIGEAKIIKTILISSLTVIIICSLLYFIYILLGQFFTTIFLAVIISAAIKPTKDTILSYINNRIDEQALTVNRCWLVYLFECISYIVNSVTYYFRVPQEDTETSPKLRDRIKDFSIIYLLNMSGIIYLFIAKVDFEIIIELIITLFIADLIIRTLFDCFVVIIGYLKSTKFNKILFKDNEFNESVHSLLAFILIFLFMFIITIICILFIWLSYQDLKSLTSLFGQYDGYLSKLLRDVIPDKIKFYYESDLNQIAYDNIYVKMKSFEEFLNFTEAETKIYEFKNSNYTIYRI
jgi:hypothetical protein